MYKNKDKNYAVIAIIYYVLFILGYILMGILYKCGVKYYSVIQWLFLIIAIESSPNLCVNSSSSYISPSMLPLSSGDLIEWCLVCHSTLSYQKFCD